MTKGKNPWENENPWADNSKSDAKTKVEDFTKFVKRNNSNNQNNNLTLKIKWLVLGLLTLWLLSGFYQVEPNEQGVVLRFGAYQDTTDAGLHYHFPYPIETVEKVNQTQERSFTLGENNSASYSSYANSNGIYRISNSASSSYDNFTESHMLTGDENIVDINLTVVWKVKNAKDYLFSVRDPEQTVYVAAQSVLREIVGQSKMQAIITEDRGRLEDETKNELQALLDEFNSGIQIVRVKMQKADPPQQVVDAFNEVQRAKADMEKFQNQAQAYRNQVIPQARGESAQVVNDAEAYRESVINKAQGEMDRYLAVYNAYKQGREVTAKKLYLETMEEVIGKSNKVIVDPSSKGANPLPILPINKFN
ncbi:MAG: FtsH protease activity modulator HflK [Alphaproteobacteria bacterium]|nr:FtsH protease activity modulator HflK [Alphaproteobacteria bacterium]